ncbi:hypothetical protein F5882DRAFT_232761, partial [Hyaloscypha sp. PMI_1271]
LREVYLLSLFYYIKIQFLAAGFNRLKNLMKLDTCYYIVSFTYIVLELLKANKYISYLLKILDFNYFKSNLLTPNNYIEIVKDLYNNSSKANKYPLYIVIYKTI